MKRGLAILFLYCGGAFCQQTATIPPVQLGGLTTYLSLSEQQVGQLQRIYQVRTQTMRQLWDRISEKQRALNALLESAAPDPAAVGSLMIDVQNARRQIGDQSSHDAARKLLSGSQRKKLADLEETLRLRPALDQAVMTGLIEQRSYAPMIPPLTVANSSVQH